MSLAPASSRGFFLKARLAVNGIQCAARSLGTLTAAGRGLLSSMGASSSFVAWRVAAQAISFGAPRERHGPHYFRPIGRFSGQLAAAPKGAEPHSEIGGPDPEYLALGILGVEPE